MGIVGAHHQCAVEGQSLAEGDECVEQTIEVLGVGVHVVAVDVGDYGDHRTEMQERSVALVRFGDQVATTAESGIALGSIQRTAH